VTIQPASEMEEMEMLRRAIEISMLEEKSRKTEHMLINKPVSPLRGPTLESSSSSENTVILGLSPRNAPPPPRSSRNDTAAVGGSDSSLFPSFHNESPVTGLPLYAAPAAAPPHPPRTSGLSELRQNSEPLRDSPTRALGNMAPIGTPPPMKPTTYYTQPTSASIGVGAAVYSTSGSGASAAAASTSAAPPTTTSSAAKTTRLPPGLGTSNITPLAKEEAKPTTNGYYDDDDDDDDTAVIMPSFQNDPYNFETEFQSDGSEEFVSDDEFDTPIFTGGVPPIIARQNFLPNPAMVPMMVKPSSQMHSFPAAHDSLLLKPQSVPLTAPSQQQQQQQQQISAKQQQQPSQQPPHQASTEEKLEPVDQKIDQSVTTKNAPMKNGTTASNACPAKSLEERNDPAAKEDDEGAQVKVTAPKPSGHKPANFQNRPVVYSNKLCKHGLSCWSMNCPFRHPERESGGVPTTPSEDSKSFPPFKTRECWKFIKYGDCQFGNACHFAHGKHDLRAYDNRKAK